MNGIRFVAVLFFFGGVMRLLADSSVFEAVGIGSLWVDAPYFRYIYRVLGAFVVLTGVFLWMIGGQAAGDARRERAAGWGLAFVGVVMATAGWRVDLPLEFYAVDVAFAWLVAGLLLRRSRRSSRSSRSERS